MSKLKCEEASFLGSLVEVRVLEVGRHLDKTVQMKRYQLVECHGSGRIVTILVQRQLIKSMHNHIKAYAHA